MNCHIFYVTLNGGDPIHLKVDGATVCNHTFDSGHMHVD